MPYFFNDLDSLHRLTLSLEAHPERFRCHRCQRSDQFVSHGFVYKKQHHGEKRAVGKRLFCANRDRRTGCGATLRLSLADTMARLRYAALHVQGFILALIDGASIVAAYQQATGVAEARHAWRWLTQLQRRLGDLRTSLHRHDTHDGAPFAHRCHRLRVLLPTLAALTARWGDAFVARYQSHVRRPFLG